ncbi:MAG TPA: polysaccharide biosynthesis/export family protein [Bryobacteraceae bacterium]|nr:polysaccharide biosynthesis/export family protein [Bryobacteraceae bacterium]
MQLKAAFIVKSLITGLMMVSAVSLPAAEPDSTVPNELIQYVRSARKAGLKDGQILQAVVSNGWPEPVAKQALASLPGATAPKSGTADSARGVAESKAPAAASQTGPDPASKAPTSAQAATGTLVAGGPTKLTPLGTPPVGAPLANGPAATAANADMPRDYVIGEGDVLQVSVFGEPTASVQAVVVRPDGKISVPLLGDIQASGFTPTDLAKSLTEKLNDLIKAADVTIVVTQINSKKVYIVGAVKKEGPIPYTYRMRVMQAISEAGGLTDYAKRKRIYVLRNENGKSRQLPFDYAAVLKGQRMETNVELLPGDTLVVPH